MSLPSRSRTSLLRRGLVVLATSATLVAGGLVAAPAAQAVPVVDIDDRDGTVVTTRMQAGGDLINGNTRTNELYPVVFRYKVDLGWTGGKLRAFDGVVTLQRVGGSNVRRYPVTVDRHGNAGDTVRLPGRINPGFYRVGIEFTAALQRPDGQVNRHRVNINNSETVSIRRATWVKASIANPTATDGRPSRISGKVQALSIAADGDLSWATVHSGTVHLSYDPDGPWKYDAKNVYVRALTIPRDGTFSTVVSARDRWWKLTYAGNDRFAKTTNWLPQGDHEGCGC
ncbi:hypothetical protein ACFS27_11055 [Promicromonospora vindobonensis]|uniref:Uncharacterized protein n=1 Tax=Promicromonospora vindobonensis TaxID=195748 RepID=A0ABW5VQX4_9MICO